MLLSNQLFKTVGAPLYCQNTGKHATGLGLEGLQHREEDNNDQHHSRNLVEQTQERGLVLAGAFGQSAHDPAAHDVIDDQADDDQQFHVEPTRGGDAGIDPQQGKAEDDHQHHGVVHYDAIQPALHDLQLLLDFFGFGFGVIDEQARQVKQAGEPGNYCDDMQCFEH